MEKTINSPRAVSRPGRLSQEILAVAKVRKISVQDKMVVPRKSGATSVRLNIIFISWKPKIEAKRPKNNNDQLFFIVLHERG